jgi:hypothetical protein
MMTEDQKRVLRIGKLDTVMNVGNELARLYRHARKGKIETIEAFRLSGVLNALRQCLEASAIEQRIAELEATIMGRAVSKPKLVSLEDYRSDKQHDPQAS